MLTILPPPEGLSGVPPPSQGTFAIGVVRAGGDFLEPQRAGVAVKDEGRGRGSREREDRGEGHGVGRTEGRRKEMRRGREG